MAKTLNPKLRALYLLAMAVGVFFVPHWYWVASLAASQVILWLYLGLGLAPLLRQLKKLSLFCALIFVAYALVSEDPSVDRWHELSLPFALTLDINIHGAMVGLTMVLRVIAVVLASHVARAGDAKALAQGLRGIGLPKSAALALDATLSLLGSSAGKGGGKGGGGGKGDGSGGGKGKSASGFFAGIKRLAKGDVGALVDSLLNHIARVERHLEATDQADTSASKDADTENKAYLRDIAIISGIALTMLGIKALKLLPGLPFAPGHKGVILIPLYILAGFMTRSRFGATLTGLTMGSAAFLLGDGRWGIFEIAKHVSPGLLVDLLAPILLMAKGKQKLWLWALLGMLIAIGRFATVTLIALSVQAPALVFAFLLPGLAIHSLFGLFSGLVCVPLLRALDATKNESDDSAPDSLGTTKELAESAKLASPSQERGDQAPGAKSDFLGEGGKGDGGGKSRGGKGRGGKGDGSSGGNGRGRGNGRGGGQGRGNGSGGGGGQGRGKKADAAPQDSN